jgi:hypothetical protein
VDCRCRTRLDFPIASPRVSVSPLNPLTRPTDSGLRCRPGQLGLCLRAAALIAAAPDSFDLTGLNKPPHPLMQIGVGRGHAACLQASLDVTSGDVVTSRPERLKHANLTPPTGRPRLPVSPTVFFAAAPALDLLDHC